jgi:hypothetical protein
MSENNINAEAKKTDSIMYLNALEEQLGQPVSTSYITNVTTSKTNNTFSKKLFLEYENVSTDTSKTLLRRLRLDDN